MSDIVIARYQDQLHGGAKAIADRFVNVVKLSMMKAAAGIAEPSRYPLPDDDAAAIEPLCVQFLRARPEAKRTQAVAALAAQAKLSSHERAGLYGDLGRVDLTASTSVAAQVRSLPLGVHLQREEVMQLLARRQDDGGPPMPPD